MSGLETIGLIAGLAGTAVSAVGAIQQGKAQQAAFNAEAAAQERRGKEEQAAAQREAIRRRTAAQQVLSRQQAVAAASGGGATDKTVLDIMGGTAAEGKFQADTAIYEGDASAAGRRDSAAIARMQGQQARTAGFINAGSTILSGISGYAKYRTPPASSGSALPTLRYG